jgi:isoleucyl-tRNA synthetase
VEAQALRRLEAQLLDELNVKALALARSEAELEGLALARDDAGYMVGLDTAISPELADEGLARELVHRIQNLRKAAGFHISDRIVTYYQGPERIRRVLARHGDYVRQETLSRELIDGPPPDGSHAEEQRIDGQAVTLAVRRVG